MSAEYVRDPGLGPDMKRLPRKLVQDIPAFARLVQQRAERGHGSLMISNHRG